MEIVEIPTVVLEVYILFLTAIGGIAVTRHTRLYIFLKHRLIFFDFYVN